MSYVLQEAEAISRDAKMWYAKVRGHEVHNLQHDGVVMRLSRGTPAAVAVQLGETCGRAPGYEQSVEVK